MQITVAHPPIQDGQDGTSVTFTRKTETDTLTVQRNYESQRIQQQINELGNLLSTFRELLKRQQKQIEQQQKQIQQQQQWLLSLWLDIGSYINSTGACSNGTNSVNRF